jgi:hypothetical protein
MKTYDVMGQCQIPFVVLGSAAYQIVHDEELHVPKIVVGVLEQHAMPECTSLLQSIDPTVEINMDGWTFTLGSAKCIVRVLTKKYHTLLDPDTHFYWVEPFRVPNPWNEYWNGDHLDI